MEFVAYCKSQLRGVFGTSETGGATVEYVLALALIALACIGAVFVFGDELVRKFEYIAERVTNLR